MDLRTRETSEIEFSYFDAASVGEPIRWILHYANVKFTDERISYEDWPKQKSRKLLNSIAI
jgi:hypothetical protein